MTFANGTFMPRIARRRRMGVIFAFACGSMVVLAIIVLGVLLASLAEQGWRWLSLDFLDHFPSRLNPEKAGVKSALFGTLWLIGLTASVSVPIGLGAAIYLHEYARKNKLTRFIELNIANLAGVPSIVNGILGLAVFIRMFDLGRSVIAGALTLSLLILPVSSSPAVRRWSPCRTPFDKPPSRSERLDGKPFDRMFFLPRCRV